MFSIYVSPQQKQIHSPTLEFYQTTIASSLVTSGIRSGYRVPKPPLRLSSRPRVDPQTSEGQFTEEPPGGTTSYQNSWFQSHMLNVWYIYLQNWVFFGANVGKSSSTMEHMGMIIGVVKMGKSTRVSLLGSSRYGTSLPDIFVDCFRGRVLSRNCVSNQNDLCCIYSEFFQFRKTRSTEMWKTYQTYQTWKS